MAATDDGEKASVAFRGKGQANRLNSEKAASGGQVGIFGQTAQDHDASIGNVAADILSRLQSTYINLEFRRRPGVTKHDIHKKLKSIDENFGVMLYVENSNIKPDGGLTEVKDKNKDWRIILIGESKHQGNDVEMIRAGQKQGKNKDADLMVAGNAIERIHKNILEFRNLMLTEPHFPYVVFLQGSNFATSDFTVHDPSGRPVKITHNAGSLNRIDRVTASSYGAAINRNYCENRTVNIGNSTLKLQIPSLYFQCESWSADAMEEVMWDVATTSIRILGDDLQ